MMYFWLVRIYGLFSHLKIISYVFLKPFAAIIQSIYLYNTISISLFKIHSIFKALLFQMLNIVKLQKKKS